MNVSSRIQMRINVLVEVRDPKSMMENVCLRPTLVWKKKRLCYNLLDVHVVYATSCLQWRRNLYGIVQDIDFRHPTSYLPTCDELRLHIFTEHFLLSCSLR